MGGRANNYLNNLWSYPRTSLSSHIIPCKRNRHGNCQLFKKGREKFLLLSSHACCCLKCAFLPKLTETRQQLIGSVGTSMKFKPQENSSRTMPRTYTIAFSFWQIFFYKSMCCNLLLPLSSGK